jgi:hypothetical protein
MHLGRSGAGFEPCLGPGRKTLMMAAMSSRAGGTLGMPAAFSG